MSTEFQQLRSECLSPGAPGDFYDFGRVLGKGGFATVRLGTKVADKSEVALKIINPKAYLSDINATRQLFHEIRVMKMANAIKNPNLASLIGAYEDIIYTTGMPRLTLAMNLYSGGELFDRIIAADHFSEQQAAKLIAKLAKAFSELHAAGIVHRDLKPENVLYDSPAPDAEPILADFGLAKISSEAHDVHHGIVGTPGYVSPEIIAEKLYMPAGDVWALGVLTYILLCGYPPFYAEDNNVELFSYIRAGSFEFHEDKWGAISPAAKDLIQRMLTVDHTKRITTVEVLSHPWISTLAPDVHLKETVSRLTGFNAKRKYRSALKAVLFGTRHGLKEAVRSAVGHATTGVPVSFPAAKLEQLAALFSSNEKVAAAGDRSITLTEFQTAMGSTSSGLGKEELEKLFHLLDSDGSGSVDHREVLAALARLHESNEAVVTMCFKLFDTDGSGGLSVTELGHLLASTGVLERLAKPEVAAASSNSATSAGAGSTASTPSSTATGSDEFSPHMKAIEDLFRRIDANKDGKISFEEFKAAIASDPLLSSAIFS